MTVSTRLGRSVVAGAWTSAAPGPLRFQSPGPSCRTRRAAGSPAGLAERLRDVAAGVDPTLHVDEVRTLAEIYRQHRFANNLGAITIGAVTGSVLLQSAAGLYALMAFAVAQRRREIGIRSALGAQPGHLVAAVFSLMPSPFSFASTLVQQLLEMR